MRIRLLALILAIAVGVTLAVTLTARAANTPQNAVERILQQRNPADACAQLVLPYRSIGRCIVNLTRAPSHATNLVISHIFIRGTHATLQANYDNGPTNRVETHYRLVQRHGRWLITGTFLPVYTIRHP
jgi:hypothetical protein